MNEKTIKEALLKGERVTLECKKAKSEVPKSVWETYSAFANIYGGLVLLGVQENLEEKDDSNQYNPPNKLAAQFAQYTFPAWFWNTTAETLAKKLKHRAGDLYIKIDEDIIN